MKIIEIGKISGNNSIKIKENLICSLLRSVSSVEGKFIIRFLNKNLVIGAAEKVF